MAAGMGADWRAQRRDQARRQAEWQEWGGWGGQRRGRGGGAWGAALQRLLGDCWNLFAAFPATVGGRRAAATRGPAVPEV